MYAGIPPPRSRPPQSRHPPEQTPPGAGTPRSRHPQEQTPPPGADTPPWSRHPPADGYCCRWYASHWNAFLCHLFLLPANEVCEGYVFTGVCLSTGGGVSIQGGLSRGVSGPRGLCPGGLCLEGISVKESPPPDGKERAVCILLKYILVKKVRLLDVTSFDINMFC